MIATKQNTLCSLYIFTICSIYVHYIFTACLVNGDLLSKHALGPHLFSSWDLFTCSHTYFWGANVIATKENTFPQNSWLLFFLGVFGLRCVHISVKLGVFLFLTATLFRHCIIKLKVQHSMGMHKLITEHF